MADKILSAGDPIESQCTKCRKLTNHIIIAIDNSQPAKVQCNTCGGQHKYRPTTTRKAPAAGRNVDPKLGDKKEWARRYPEIDGQHAKEYSMSAVLKRDDVVRHPIFGLGIVQEVIGQGKVEILFEDGKKKMRCK